MKVIREKLLLAIRVSLKCSLVAWKCIVKKVSLKISVLESLYNAACNFIKKDFATFGTNSIHNNINGKYAIFL